MNSALLNNGKIITAREYNADSHGNRLFCMDCRAPVVFVTGTENSSPYFKTTGKSNEGKHKPSCGFFKPLTFSETLKKVEEYQGEFLEKDKGIKETIIKINLNKIDPDYESASLNNEEKQLKNKTDSNEIKIKQDSQTPSTVSSLRSMVKLLTSYEPDILSTIIVDVKGNKIPLSSLIVDQEKAHRMLWQDEIIDKIGYFVHGTVEKVIRRDKVIYIVLKPLNNVLFSLVIFDKYFKHFTYTDAELVGKKVLSYGHLKKNSFKDKNTREMSIKSNKYLEFINNL
ncbi:hypothetical protein ACFFIX_19600 [Metabacillus herbersteinensis]|uniref:DUF7828 domain-containing protein n=1 Tax=Metabacillus herbersteinensis TaxID=283816 RepID=A0ABV6GIT8_9BACI